MKYLLIASLLLVVAGLIYWRMRPYIAVARRIFSAVRDVQVMSGGARSNSAADLPRRQRADAPAEDKLLRCAACGTWTPASRAIRPRASASAYCSHDCLERAADSPRTARKSAS